MIKKIYNLVYLLEYYNEILKIMEFIYSNIGIYVKVVIKKGEIILKLFYVIYGGEYFGGFDFSGKKNVFKKII